MNALSMVTSALNSSFYSIGANAVQDSLNDPRIIRIANGISFAIGGLSLIAMSGALRYWSWCCRRENPAQVGRLQWGAAGLGLAATVYGIYQTAMGLLENACETRLEQGKQDLLSCPYAQELWNNLEREGPFTIRCAKIGQTTINGALVDTYNRQIFISPTLNPVIKHLFFELSFLNRSKIVAMIINSICDLNKSDFTELMEVNRYDSIMYTHTVSKRCVDGGFWSKSLAWAEDKLSFKIAEEEGNSWKKYQIMRQQGYGANKYRLAWDAVCNSNIDTFKHLLKNWSKVNPISEPHLALLTNKSYVLNQYLSTDWPGPGEE